MGNFINLDDTKNLKFNPIIFFSAGEALGYKDRDNNIDAKMIQRFFEPIDKLFGDYEIMKKFGIHHKLYQNKIFNYTDDFIGELNDIEKITFFDNESEDYQNDPEFKLDVLKSNILKDPKAILIIFLIFDKNKMAFRIGTFVINNNDIFLNQKAEYFNKISDKIGNDYKIIQTFAIDPEKLIQIGDIDDAFQTHYRRVIKRDTKTKEGVTKKFIGFVNAKKLELEKVGKLNEFNINRHETIEELLTYLNIQNDAQNYEDYKKLALNFRNRTYKLKLFEPHVYFKIRLGYENDHFVLFLHPYESESNNPVRFPPGGQ
ncbi:hypothetical protein EGI22_23050 [Lacihabitans sp. LS3-19]|uniref:hypothetical protein n=1 Tax=Lacihabitans sp. LS3-19 TaxID=2487335 RepID=UPI0020CD027E|nr:hypothetical protein [Lacihabitans sp. LS3-19]MCP9770793.1 hypothetical protein [Lacihabitans sp. LS3-19]